MTPEEELTRNRRDVVKVAAVLAMGWSLFLPIAAPPNWHDRREPYLYFTDIPFPLILLLYIPLGVTTLAVLARSTLAWIPALVWLVSVVLALPPMMSGGIVAFGSGAVLFTVSIREWRRCAPAASSRRRRRLRLRRKLVVFLTLLRALSALV